MADEVFHAGTDLMSRYAGQRRELSDGQNSAVYECLAKPQLPSSPQAMAEVLEA